MEVVAVCLVAGGAWGLHALSGRLARGLARVGLEVTLFATPMTGLVWMYGVLAMSAGDWSDPCGERDVGLQSMQDDLFPPSSVCTWEDGLQVQQVPSWVAPVLCVSLAAAVLGASVAGGAAVVVHRRLTRAGV